VSDRDTDANGETVFANPLFGGGWYTDATQVVISGDVLPYDINLRFNSPDINGDLVTNLTDCVLSTVSLYGAYEYKCDYNADNVVNITDAGYMSAGLGTTSP